MIRRVLYRISLAVLFLGLPLICRATHQKAAELRVEHVSGYTYRAILITYTYTGTDVDRPEIEIAWGDGLFETVPRLRYSYVGNETRENRYEATHTYSGPGVYTLYMEDPNRNAGVVNIPGSVLTYMYVSTTITISPWLGAGSSTPVTTISPVDDNACLGKLFTHNPGAYDPDGDSISYRLIPCRTMNGEEIPGYNFPAASDSFYIDAFNGTLFWNAPMAQGEYNVAILMEEWRNRIKIGSLTRDMQIVVRSCGNHPPEIVAEERYCVEAGQVVNLPVVVRDRDRNRLHLEATGEILTGGRRAGLQGIFDSVDSAVYNFYWVTDLSESRTAPYLLYLRAEDNGDPHLSAVKTVAVTVLAPAVHFSDVVPEKKKVSLAWTKSLSPHAAGYELYRRDFWAEEHAVDSCTTGIADTAYRLIASLPASDTAYTDTALEEGREYCYKVVVNFADGARSRASEPFCMEVPNISPLLTKVSVLETDEFNGKVEVDWVKPQDVDSVAFYRLWGGYTPDSLAFIAEFAFDSCVHYIDSGRNTQDLRYFYQVEAEENLSSPASSVYLTATGKPHRVELGWTWQSPWEISVFFVYRYNDFTGIFEKIDSTTEAFYIDRAVSVDHAYRYRVEAVGSYRSRRLPDSLYNLSNQVTGTALPGEPCQPYLFLLQSSCNPLYNTLTWSFDSVYRRQDGEAADAAYIEDCRSSVDYYELYRRIPGQKEYEWVATVTETEYEDTEPGSLFACYQVVAVNESGRESLPSNALCTDNWHCFVFDLPNVFTPNADGVNDVLRARDYSLISKFSIRIVNRWGVEVFKSDDPAFEWNGKLYNKGSVCPDGAYFYMAEFEGHAEGRTLRKVQSGSVTILR